MNKKLQKRLTSTMAAAMAMGVALPATTVLAAPAKVSNGWHLVAGKWYFYNNSTTVKNAWKQDSSKKWFFLGASGAMVTNKWAQDSSKKWFFLGADGAMVTNKWAQDSTKLWFYLGTDGAMAVNTITLDGYTVNAYGAWDGLGTTAQKAEVAAEAAATTAVTNYEAAPIDTLANIALANGLGTTATEKVALVLDATKKTGFQTRIDAQTAKITAASTALNNAAETAPVISSVSLKSSNIDSTRARVGDTVTLTFKTNQEVFKLGNFKINGSNPTTFSCTGSGTNWTTVATYVLEDSDPEGAVNFQINVKNAAGIYSITTEATTDASLVTVTKSPEILAVDIASNNADPTIAKVGDTVKLTFTTKEEVTKLSNFKINGGNPASFSCTGFGTNWITVATYVIDSSDPEGAVNFQINVKDAAGYNSITTEATTDGTSVGVVWSVAQKVQQATDAVVAAEASKLQADVVAAKTLVDALPADVAPATTKADLEARLAAVTAPVISNVSFRTVTNVDGDGLATTAVIGDTITLTFTSDENVTKLGNFKINGSNPNTFTQVGDVYFVTHLVDAGDVAGAATFQINVQNAAGVYSTTVENTTDGSAITIH